MAAIRESRTVFTIGRKNPSSGARLDGEVLFVSYHPLITQTSTRSQRPESAIAEHRNRRLVSDTIWNTSFQCLSGGGEQLDNLALACPTCNYYKAVYTEGVDDWTATNVRLFNPRTDN